MKSKKLIAPSLLSADFLHLEREINDVQEAGADMLHLDVMDGHFVPNMTFGSFIVRQIKSIAAVPLDVHLMIENPQYWISAYIDAGADFLTIHYEADCHLNRSITEIKKLGRKAGVSINPSTHPMLLEYILEHVDLVLVMSVNPGFGGQRFIENSVRKIEWLFEYRERHGLDFLIEVDGGVNENNIKQLSEAGVDIFVAGNAIFSKDNYKAVIEKMRESL